MNRWGPKWISGRSRNQTPSFILYLPSILYPLYCIFFYPICCLSVQSVYTNATPNHVPLISPLLSPKWLSHALFDGLAYNERL